MMFSKRCFCDVVAVDYIPNYKCNCVKIFSTLNDCFLIKREPYSQLDICKAEKHSFFYCKNCLPLSENGCNGSYFEEIVQIPKGFKYYKLIYCRTCSLLL